MIPQVTYWFGVVEDINDPEMLDRVRVRVYGAHSENKSISDIEGTPTEHLMWMNTIMPTTAAQFGGIGERHGLVPGSTVFGMYIDPEFQQGMVLGQMTTKNTGIKDSNKGFSDPTGQFGMELTEGTSSLPLPGQGVATDGAVNGPGNEIAQLGSYTPDLNTPGQESDSDVTLFDMLKYHEGFFKVPSKDGHGMTVGHGHQLIGNSHDLGRANQELSRILGRPATQITYDEAAVLLQEDIVKFTNGIRQFSKLHLIYNQLNDSRKKIFICWCYQLGFGGVLKFTNTLSYIQQGKWKEAYQGMMSSAWAKQTAGRAKLVATCMYNGNLEPYEILFGKKKAGPKPKTPDSAGGSNNQGSSGNRAFGIANKTAQVAQQLGLSAPQWDPNNMGMPGIDGQGYKIPGGHNINKIIIHCTATQNGREMQISQMDEDHLKRGWKRSEKWRQAHNPHIKALGYQFVIGLNGQIHSGRAVGEQGCHTGKTGLNCNVGSIGISLQGGSDKFPNASENGGRFTAAQWLSLTKLINDILKVYPQCSVKGHRDWIREAHELGTGKPTAKACPAFNVQSWWRSGGGINQKHLLN